jgi:hypothetical protein
MLLLLTNLIQLFMKKRISTLVMGVLALITSSLSMESQNATYDVLNPIVNVNKSGFSDLTINWINPDKYYQIELSNATTVREATPQAYLAVRRNPQSGELYLYEEGYSSNLNMSLWKITTVRHGVAGYTYTLTNKATGFELTFNDAMVDEYPRVLPLTTDVTEWQWYSDPDVSGTSSKLGFVPFYAYNHDGSKIIGLTSFASDGTISVKSIAQAGFQDRDAAKEFLQLRVVEARPRVLNADEVNTMIDASNQAYGVLFKSSPKVSNDLFGTKIKAEQLNPSVFPTVEETHADYSSYAGYSIFLMRKSDGTYFRVDPDSTYDYNTLPIANGGFKVGFAPLKGLDKNVIHEAVDTTVAKLNAANPEEVDPLIARYLWRVTYYPTPDSLVLEPFNASSISKFDKQSGKKWLESGLTKASMFNFFNTINRGIPHEDGILSINEGTGPGGNLPNNVNFSKDENAVVALTIYNEGNGSYDSKPVLTVGTARNVVGYNEISEETTIVNANVNLTDGIANMGIKVSFDSKYNYLTRATLPTGLYFIQLASTSNNDLFRKAGKYYVDNHSWYYDVRLPYELPELCSHACHTMVCFAGFLPCKWWDSESTNP